MEINNGFAEKRSMLESRSEQFKAAAKGEVKDCLLYTSPSPRDRQKSRMPSSA